MRKYQYIVIMYRWGDTENHSYPIGVFSTMKKAKFAGEREEGDRGGKYTAFIYKSLLNPVQRMYRITSNVENSLSYHDKFCRSKATRKLFRLKEKECFGPNEDLYVLIQALHGKMDCFLLLQSDFKKLYEPVVPKTERTS